MPAIMKNKLWIWYMTKLKTPLKKVQRYRETGTIRPSDGSMCCESHLEIMEHFTTEEVLEATAQIVEYTPEIDLKLKADHISVKALLADIRDQIHIAKVYDKYVLMIEADSLTFEKGFSLLSC